MVNLIRFHRKFTKSQRFYLWLFFLFKIKYEYLNKSMSFLCVTRGLILVFIYEHKYVSSSFISLCTVNNAVYGLNFVYFISDNNFPTIRIKIEI